MVRASRRQHSLPANSTINGNSNPDPHSASSFSNHLPSTDRTSSESTLLAKADALAKMTLELNLRAVANQADRLEQDMKRRAICTNEDKKFRENHEKKMNEVHSEILVVRKQLEDAGIATLPAELSKYRQQMEQTVQDLRNEISGLKDTLRGISKMVQKLPVQNKPNKSAKTVETVEMSQDTQTTLVSPPSASASTYQADGPRNFHTAKTRIREAISSTRRWNRDYKSTMLDDGRFVTNYLQQQFKRDPELAVFIQKTIKRRIRLRLATRASQPQTLEEFCEHVEWSDVKAAVEEVLVQNTSETVKALS